MNFTGGNSQSLAAASAKAEALMCSLVQPTWAFQGDVVKEDFAGPSPCENWTGCTFPWSVRAGQNMQPQHDLEEHFRALGPVCSIPELESKQRLLAALTH